MNQIKVELQDSFGNDFSICSSAWTSSLDHSKHKQKTDEDIKKLINYLADNKHSTPFESVIFRFWIKIPIQTDRQMMSHRLQSSSGMSGRYRTMPNEYLEPSQDIDDILLKMPDLKYPNMENIKMDPIEKYFELCEKSNNFYNCFLQSIKKEEKNGIISNNEYKRLREFFRGVLPQNNMTERVSIFNLRSWANFYKLRSSSHAQPEIQQVAKLMLEAIEKANICPIAILALRNNNWNI